MAREKYRLQVVEEGISGETVIMCADFNTVEEANHFESELNTKWMNANDNHDAFGVGEENHFFKSKEDIDDEEPSYVSTVEIIDTETSDEEVKRFIPDYAIAGKHIIVDGSLTVGRMFNTADMPRDLTMELQVKDDVKRLVIKKDGHWFATLPVVMKNVNVMNDALSLHINYYEEMVLLRNKIMALYNAKI